MLVSNEEAYKKVLSIKDNVPSLKDIYTFDNIANSKNYREIIELGILNSNLESELINIKNSIKSNDLFTIILSCDSVPKNVIPSLSGYFKMFSEIILSPALCKKTLQ